MVCVKTMAKISKGGRVLHLEREDVEDMMRVETKENKESRQHGRTALSAALAFLQVQGRRHRGRPHGSLLPFGLQVQAALPPSSP